MSDYVQIMILCEDRQQEVFARYFLEKSGINPKRIRVNICPPGRMAGEQYVRETYPKEVREYRGNATRLAIGLVVMIDADRETVAARTRQLADALREDGQGERHVDERIALFIPKRNIETWVHFLMGTVVNETDVYGKLDRESDCKSCVRHAAAKPEYRLTQRVPPSLHSACAELRRIVPGKRCVQQESDT